MKKFLEATLMLGKWMDWVAGTVLVLIMLLTSLDVILRYLRHPIPGTYDLVSLGAAFVAGFAIPRTSLDRTHVSVDILIEKLPAARGVFDVATRVMALALFLLLGWNLVEMGTGYLRTGETTQTLLLPFYPIAFALGICAFAECIVLLSDIGSAVIKWVCHE